MNLVTGKALKVIVNKKLRDCRVIIVINNKVESFLRFFSLILLIFVDSLLNVI